MSFPKSCSSCKNIRNQTGLHNLVATERRSYAKFHSQEGVGMSTERGLDTCITNVQLYISPPGEHFSEEAMNRVTRNKWLPMQTLRAINNYHPPQCYLSTP